MHRYSQEKVLTYTSKQLFNIIIDVEKYPEYLPWCKGAEIVKKNDKYNFDAKLIVGYRSINETYTSKVTSRYLTQIDSNAIEGPFSYLESSWKFKDINNKKCKVKFFIDYEFKSFILGKLMGSLFKKASEKMFYAFETRARDLHG